MSSCVNPFITDAMRLRSATMPTTLASRQYVACGTVVATVAFDCLRGRFTRDDAYVALSSHTGALVLEL
jgi:hypothetical protein